MSVNALTSPVTVFGIVNSFRLKCDNQKDVINR